MATPGTHDSATYKLKVGEAKCQYDSKSLEQQLKDGIRFFDLRVGWRWQHTPANNPRLVHAAYDCDVLLSDAMKTFRAFLKEHSKETLLISIKKESWDVDKYDFEEAIGVYLDKDRNLWFIGDYLPRLGEVRGKMMFLLRTCKPEVKYKGYKLIPWVDKEYFTIPEDEETGERRTSHFRQRFPATGANHAIAPTPQTVRHESTSTSFEFTIR